MRRRTITVGPSRRFKVAVNCPATTGSRCAGTLRVERRHRNLVHKSFRVTADAFRNINARLTRSHYRALKRSKKGRKVTITVLTRDASGTLRRVSTTVTMRAKR